MPKAGRGRGVARHGERSSAEYTPEEIAVANAVGKLRVDADGLGWIRGMEPSAHRGAGRPPRSGSAARNVSIRLTDTELAQLDAYVAKHGRDRSHWVRRALAKLGALKGGSK